MRCNVAGVMNNKRLVSECVLVCICRRTAYCAVFWDQIGQMLGKQFDCIKLVILDYSILLEKGRDDNNLISIHPYGPVFTSNHSPDCMHNVGTNH